MAATIREKGYYHWEGRLVERKRPWFPITRTGIMLAFRKKRFKFVFAGAFVPALVFLAGVYISERLEDFKTMFRGAVEHGFLNIDPKYFMNYLTNDALLFFIVIVLVFAGAGLVADDLRHNSLQLYFSRPLRKRDYLLGKMSVVYFFALIYTLVPGLVIFIFKLVFSGSFKFFLTYPLLPLQIIAYSALVTIFLAFYTLLLSATSKNNRYVMIMIFLVYIFSDVLYGILWGVFRSPYMALFSIKGNIKQAGAFIFAQKPPFAFPPLWSFVVLAAVCGLSAVILDRKIRGVEVIK